MWASTGTKDPDASETLYVEAQAAPDTIELSVTGLTSNPKIFDHAIKDGDFSVARSHSSLLPWRSPNVIHMPAGLQSACVRLDA